MSLAQSRLGVAFTSTFHGAGWHPRLVVSLVSFVFLFEAVALQYLAASTVLPLVSARFETMQAAWLLTIYALTGAVTAPLVGKLADKFGKRRLLFAVMVLSVLGSLTAASAQSFEMLLVGRVLEGFLTAAAFLNYSLVRDVYPPKTVPFAATVTLTGSGVLSIFAPILVGRFVDDYGFRSIFILNAALVVVLIVSIALTTPESEVRSRSTIDWLGAALIAASVGSILTGISMGNTWGWTNTSTLGSIAGGVVVGIVYVFYALHRAEPLLDVRIFGRRAVLIATAVNTASTAAQTVALVLVPIIGLTPSLLGGGYGLGLTATDLARIMSPAYVIGTIGGLATGILVRAIGAWSTARIGLVAFAIGLTYLGIRHDTIPDMIVGAALILVGCGLCLGSVPNMVIASSPVHEQGTYASGLQLISATTAATAPVLLFVVLGRSATAGPGGAVVYTDSAISQSYFGCLALVLVVLVLLSTTLRPKADAAVLDEDPGLLLSDRIDTVPRAVDTSADDPVDTRPLGRSAQP